MANPTWHPPVEVVANDDWSIAGNLRDIDGGPLDASSAVLEWLLVGPDGVVARSSPGLAEVTVQGTPGASSSRTRTRRTCHRLLEDLVRLDNAARRAVKQLGRLKPAGPKLPTLAEHLAARRI